MVSLHGGSVDIEAGHGLLHCTKRGSKALFARIGAKYPLKLVPTKSYRERLAIAYMITYGGGLLSGDEVHLDVIVDSECRLLLLTQGNTKVFKERKHLQRSLDSIQTMNVRLEPSSILFLLPDPVTCFATASYQQTQRFHLTSLDTDGIVLLDWLTSGRASRGESWQFQKYHSRNEVYVGDKLVVRDAVLLQDRSDPSPSRNSTTYAQRVLPYHCLATLIILGQPFTRTYTHIQDIFGTISIHASSKPRDLQWTCSEICQGKGLVVRIAGTDTEAVKTFINDTCLALEIRDMVGGENLFHRSV